MEASFNADFSLEVRGILFRTFADGLDSGKLIDTQEDRDGGDWLLVLWLSEGC